MSRLVPMPAATLARRSKFCCPASISLAAACALSAFMRSILPATASWIWPMRAAIRAETRPTSFMSASGQLIQRRLERFRLVSPAGGLRRDHAGPAHERHGGAEEGRAGIRVGGFEIFAKRLLA